MVNMAAAGASRSRSRSFPLVPPLGRFPMLASHPNRKIPEILKCLRVRRSVPIVGLFYHIYLKDVHADDSRICICLCLTAVPPQQGFDGR